MNDPDQPFHLRVTVWRLRAWLYVSGRLRRGPRFLTLGAMWRIAWPPSPQQIRSRSVTASQQHGIYASAEG